MPGDLDGLSAEEPDVDEWIATYVVRSNGNCVCLDADVSDRELDADACWLFPTKEALVENAIALNEKWIAQYQEQNRIARDYLERLKGG